VQVVASSFCYVYSWEIQSYRLSDNAGNIYQNLYSNVDFKFQAYIMVVFGKALMTESIVILIIVM